MLLRHHLCMYLAILTMIFHRVHSAIEEVSSLHDPLTKHFILAVHEQLCSLFSRHAMSSLAVVIGPR